MGLMVEPICRVVSEARFQIRLPSLPRLPPTIPLTAPPVSVMTKADWGYSSLLTGGKFSGLL